MENEEKAQGKRKFDWKNFFWLLLGVLIGMGIPDFIAGVIEGIRQGSANP